MPADSESSVLIVIVNYRTPDLTIDCLLSLQSALDVLPNLKVTVVDGFSNDESVKRITDHIENVQVCDRICLLPLRKNGGFAYGNNAAIVPALKLENAPQYVFLLNPDTVVRPHSVSKLVQFMDENPEVGICGCRLEDPDGAAQRSAFRFPSLTSEFAGNTRTSVFFKLFEKSIVAPPVVDRTMPTDWVSGAAMIVRREVFDAIGTLDSAFFMYFEEVDFCLRANRAGFSCCYFPSSRIVHLVGQASGIDNLEKRRAKYWFESRRRFFLKNFGAAYALASDIAFVTGELIWRSRCLLQRKDRQTPPQLLRDFIRQSVLFRGFQIESDSG